MNPRRLLVGLITLFAACAVTPLPAQARTYTYDCIGVPKASIGDTGKTWTRLIARDTARAGATVCYALPTAAPAPAPVPLPAPPVPAGGGATIFSDGFESNGLGFTQNGVAWGSHPYVSVTTAIAHSGTHSAVFDQSTGWGELRFGGFNLPEAYVQFWLYVPPSYSTASSANDKFFRLWGTSDADYDTPIGEINKVGASSRGANLFIESVFSPSAVPANQYNIGQTLDLIGPGHETASVPFYIPANYGRWLRIGIHAKNATSVNRDGVVEIFLDGVKITGYATMANYPFGSKGRHTFTNGYLLGAMNSGAHPGQKAFVDDFSISTKGFSQ